MNYFEVALLELTLLGLVSGVAGSLAVLRERSFFAVALSHASFPGGVIFAVLGLNLLLGQALFAALLVLLLVFLSRISRQGRQVASGIVLTFGFALGSLLSNLNRGLNVPVDELLVGSPFSVKFSDVFATLFVLVVGLVLLLVFWRRIIFHTFDPAGFVAAGFAVWPLELVVSGVVAGAIVVAMPAAGAILGVAVIVGPAACARLLVRNVLWLGPVAALIGVVCGVLGLFLSLWFGLAAGGAVGLVIAVVFVLSGLFKKFH